MADLLFLSSSLIFFSSLAAIYLVLIFAKLIKPTVKTLSSSHCSKLPKSYPIFGSAFTVHKFRERFIQWSSDLVTSTPTLTFNLHFAFGERLIITANPVVVRHILKTNFDNYDKGELFKNNMRDVLGGGIFNSDGESWKFQHQVSSHEFSAKSLRKFVETVVDSEIMDRLIPALENAARESLVIDIQDILQRFGSDNICCIAFGYDPGCLSALTSSIPLENFTSAFDKAVRLSYQRFETLVPYFWKIKKTLNIGSERELKVAVDQIREFAKNIIREKKRKFLRNSSQDIDHDHDLLSRFLSSGYSDDAFITGTVISFILAGRDTTSAALTWFFWLLSKHPQVENDILKEIIKSKAKHKPESELTASGYDDVKEMVYTHAALCESMRLYPPVPMDGKAALKDDVLPDGTMVKKGGLSSLCYGKGGEALG